MQPVLSSLNYINYSSDQQMTRWVTAHLCNDCQLPAQVMKAEMTYVMAVNLNGSWCRLDDTEQRQWNWRLACSSSSDDADLHIAITAGTRTSYTYMAVHILYTYSITERSQIFHQTKTGCNSDQLFNQLIIR